MYKIKLRTSEYPFQLPSGVGRPRNLSVYAESELEVRFFQSFPIRNVLIRIRIRIRIVIFIFRRCQDAKFLLPFFLLTYRRYLNLVFEDSNFKYLAVVKLDNLSIKLPSGISITYFEKCLAPSRENGRTNDIRSGSGRSKRVLTTRTDPVSGPLPTSYIRNRFTVITDKLAENKANLKVHKHGIILIFFLPKSNPYMPLVKFEKNLTSFSSIFARISKIEHFRVELSICGTTFFWRDIQNIFFSSKCSFGSY